MQRVETYYTEGEGRRGKVSKLEGTAFTSSVAMFYLWFWHWPELQQNLEVLMSKKHGHAIPREQQSKVGMC